MRKPLIHRGLSLALIAPLALAAASSPTHAAGPISLTSVDTVYTQNFDALPATGVSQAWVNGTTLEGWYGYSYAPLIASTRIIVHDGSGVGGGSIFSAGGTGSTERALGATSVSNAAFAKLSLLALAVTNNTGMTLDSFSLRYDSEQWSYGNASTPSTFTLGYRFGSTYEHTGWTSVGGAFNAASRVNSGSSRALDGNAAANRTADVGGTRLLTWAPGETLWLRWADSVEQFRNDPLMAIDNVRFSAAVTAVPEPGTWALMLAGLGSVGFLARRRAG